MEDFALARGFVLEVPFALEDDVAVELDEEGRIELDASFALEDGGAMELVGLARGAAAAFAVAFGADLTAENGSFPLEELELRESKESRAIGLSPAAEGLETELCELEPEDDGARAIGTRGVA